MDAAGHILDVFATRKKIQVMDETWGHLKPVPRRHYPCEITIAHCDNGTTIIVQTDFGPHLGGNPWTEDHLSDFLMAFECDDVGIYKFRGRYMMFKNGRGSFSGTTKQAKRIIY